MNPKTTNLISVFETAIRDNWNLTALSDFGGEPYAYKQIGERIIKAHALFEAAGVKKGDHVALIGKNSAHWCMIYLATVTYGAVIVPILPDFKPADIHYIVTHSDSLLLFVEESIYKDLDPEAMPLLRHILKIQDDSILFTRDNTFEKAASINRDRILQVTPEMINFAASHP